MMKKITFFITVLFSVLILMHKMIYGLSDAINTGSNATYLLTNSVTFNGEDLIYGKIGAFYTDDNGELIKMVDG